MKINVEITFEDTFPDTDTDQWEDLFKEFVDNQYGCRTLYITVSESDL